MRDTWTRCRVAHTGGDAVHSYDLRRAGLASDMPSDAPGWWFLPPRAKMTWRDYRVYHRLALWTGIVRRTADGMIGTLFREKPKVGGLREDAAGDVTGTGRSAVQFAADCARELLVTGQVSVLIDIPDGAVRASAMIIPAESIIGVKSEVGDKGLHPTVVRVLSQAEEPNPEDEWSPKKLDQITVLRADGGRPYRIEVWRRPRSGKEGENAGTEEEWKRYEDRPVVFADRTESELPLVCGYIEDVDQGEPQPPISGLVDLNTDHYRARAAQAYSLHSIMPTLVVIGGGLVDTDINKLALGNGNSVIMLKNTSKGQVSADLLGLGGDLSAVENRIKDTETLIARMGSRTLLDQQKSGVEAAETVRLRQSGEASALSALADAVDHVMSDVITWLNRVDGVGGDGKFELDRTALSADPTRVDMFKDLYDAGLLPRELVLKELQRIHVIPDDVTPEEIDAKIKAAAPKMVESDDDDDEDDDEDKKGKPPGGGDSGS